MFSDQKHLNDSPKINANVFSRLSFHYLNQVFNTGSKTPLEEEHLWNPTPENSGEIMIYLTNKIFIVRSIKIHEKL